MDAVELQQAMHSLFAEQRVLAGQRAHSNWELLGALALLVSAGERRLATVKKSLLEAVAPPPTMAAS